MSLNWFQRIFTREVRGSILEVAYGDRGPAGMLVPVTSYIVEGDDGKIYYGATDGHHAEPNPGDYVEMYLARGAVKIITLTPRTITWEPIKSYRILQPRESTS